MENSIQKELNNKNLSQGKLAKNIGVSRVYINKIVQGKAIPSLPIALRIAAFLQANVHDIFKLTSLSILIVFMWCVAAYDWHIEICRKAVEIHRHDTSHTDIFIVYSDLSTHKFSMK